MKRWFTNHGQSRDGTGTSGAIRPNETSFIKTEGDLVSLVPKLKTPLRRWLDRFDTFLSLKFIQIKKVLR